MRIVLTVDPEIPVPPRLYGGIERIVDMLARGLGRRGHDVHLFAHPQSKSPVARLIPYRGRRSGSWTDTLRNAADLYRYVRRLGRVHVVHSFSRLAYLLALRDLRLPMVQSYQRAITPRSVRWGARWGGSFLTFTACSRFLVDQVRHLGGRWRVIHNGVPLDRFSFRPRVPGDAPLVFLGRVERIKGPREAIEVARRTGRSLLIAGNAATSGPESEYFQREILPRCDGVRIRYVGPLDDPGKEELLGRAAAMLFPVDVDEGFGIVIAESLACGTPVIAFSRGGVPEAIDPGRTGFLCSSVEEMARAVTDLGRIDRSRCRRAAEERFSSDVIVSQYEALYESVA
jgi:glycosyltransferase involved in cell wall biosynthesis